MQTPLLIVSVLLTATVHVRRTIYDAALVGQSSRPTTYGMKVLRDGVPQGEPEAC